MTRMLSGGISIPKPPILHGRCMMCMVAKIEIFVDMVGYGLVTVALH